MHLPLAAAQTMWLQVSPAHGSKQCLCLRFASCSAGCLTCGHCLRETELYARLMVQGMPSAGKPTLGLCFNTDEEKAMVEDVFTSAVSGLSEADRNLSAIQVLPVLHASLASLHCCLLIDVWRPMIFRPDRLLPSCSQVMCLLGWHSKSGMHCYQAPAHYPSGCKVGQSSSACCRASCPC